jgi:hypothetical protein
MRGAGAGGGPHVKVFDATTLQVVHSFFALDPASPGFFGGVWVAAGDVTGDHKADVVVGAGDGSQPIVRAFGGPGLGLIAEFQVHDPFAPNAVGDIPLESGVFVGVADANGDGVGDILTGKAAGNRPRVHAYSVSPVAELESFDAYDPNFPGGVYVGGSR